MAAGGGGFGGQGRRPGGFGGAADPIAAMLRRGTNVGGYTDEDRKNAKLPLPPEQDSQVQVLLRPGLLADVEIQVEKLPDVIHVPAQAVFQKNGQFLVYVHGKDGKFEPRPVTTGQAERIDDGDRRAAYRRAKLSPWPIPPPTRRRTARKSPRAPVPPWAAWAGGNSHGTLQYRS